MIGCLMGHGSLGYIWHMLHDPGLLLEDSSYILQEEQPEYILLLEEV